MPELYQKMLPFLGDLETLFQRMAGKMDLWEECVFLFPREEIIAETDAAFRSGDDTALYGTVHRLKGNLANFGFDSAARKAMGLLAAIKEADKEKMTVWYAELKEEYLQIVERIGECE